jgi:hypothetical protein
MWETRIIMILFFFRHRLRSFPKKVYTLSRTVFLGRFKNNHEYHSFSHDASLQYNELYQYCKQLFANDSSFTEVSGNIARHLYNQSTHPKVKGGEFYIAYFDGLPVESKVCKAIGMFKTENKAFFWMRSRMEKPYNCT